MDKAGVERLQPFVLKGTRMAEQGKVEASGVSGETIASIAEGMSEDVKKGLEKMFGVEVGTKRDEGKAKVHLLPEDGELEEVAVVVKVTGTPGRKEFETRNEGCYKGQGYFLPRIEGFTWVVQVDNREHQVLMCIKRPT